MADRQTNYQSRMAQIREQSRKAKVMVGTGAALGVTGATIAIAGKAPYSGNPDVQKYAGLESRATSLRKNIESGERHPILKTDGIQNEALSEMRTELEGVETQMAEMGVVPGFAEYERAGQIQNNISLGLVLAGLTAIVAGAFKAKNAYRARVKLDRQTAGEPAADYK